MQEQSNSNKVMKGVSTQTLITILTGVIEIVGFSIMSRLLNQQDFGYYAAITAITAVFASFSDAGIGSAIVQRKEIDQKYLNNAFTLCLLFGLFGTSLMLAFSRPAAHYVADESMTVPLKLVSITLLTGTLSSISFSIMHRKLQFLRMGIIRVSAAIATTIVSVVLAIMGYGYYAIIAKIILYSLITLIVSYIVAHQKFRLAFDLNVYKEIFGFGGWLMASSFFRKIAEQIDRIMMSNLFNVTTLGMYSRPKEFINNMTGRICEIFDSSFFPVLSSMQDDNAKLKQSYETSLYYLNIVGMMVTLTFMFNSELIIRVFLGKEWMNVNSIFVVLSLSGICLINGSLGDIILRSLALTKLQFYFRIVQSFLSIIFILIAANIGVLAVAIAFLAAFTMVVLIKMKYISKRTNCGFKKCLMIIAKSYKALTIYIPVYTVCMFFMPNTILFNIVKLIIFIIISILSFVVFPDCVGSKYKIEMHNTVLLYIRRKVLNRNVFAKN